MKFVNRCWCLLLGALLPAACGDNGVEPTPEYGAPQATLKLDGVVVDERGAPVEDVGIELDGFGSTTSDATGVWSLQKVGFSTCLTDTLIECGLSATPDAHDPYQPTLVELDLVRTVPPSGWNMGTYEQHGIQIVLEDVGAEYGPLCVKAALENLLDAEKRAKRAARHQAG